MNAGCSSYCLDSYLLQKGSVIASEGKEVHRPISHTNAAKLFLNWFSVPKIRCPLGCYSALTGN